MEACLAHQLILPTDERNPSFSLYLSEDEQSIEVFYGLELLEVVPEDPEHPAFKMMVGRLANAKLRLATLEDVFNVDRKTIRSWGKAILSRDLELLARVLLGRGANQKRTPAIDKHVVRRWAELRAEGRLDFRAALAKEIENIFEVKLSGETLRQIVNEFKEDSTTIPDAVEADETGPPDYLSPAHPAPVLGGSTCSVEIITTTNDLVSNLLEPCIQATSSAIHPASDTPQASKCSPPNWHPQPGDTILCDHADDQAQRDQIQRQVTLDQIHDGIAKRSVNDPDNPAASTPTAEESKQIARHLNATKRHHKYRQARALEIETIHQEILRNDQAKAALDKEVSRIDQLIAQDMVRMDLANKTLMDAIKISARNLFYRLFAPFKTAYDNCRDDHGHYREPTQCDGVLRWTGSEIEVHLVPQVNYPPKLRKIIERHLADLNASGLTLPDGSNRPLRLRLTRKEQISVRIDDSTAI
jgi:hypothetical protein